MKKEPFDADEKREKFERTYNYLVAHPESCSAWEEIRYRYFHKGYFLEEIKNLIYSDEILLARGAAATLSEFGAAPEWAEELKKIHDEHEDETVKLRLKNILGIK